MSRTQSAQSRSGAPALPLPIPPTATAVKGRRNASVGSVAVTYGPTEAVARARSLHEDDHMHSMGLGIRPVASARIHHASTGVARSQRERHPSIDETENDNGTEAGSSHSDDASKAHAHAATDHGDRDSSSVIIDALRSRIVDRLAVPVFALADAVGGASHPSHERVK